jgi:hypothetical protein
MSALSSGDLLASLSHAVVEDVAGFVRRTSLPPTAGCPTAVGFPWPVVDQVEWMLRRAKAGQVRSWAEMVHAALTTDTELEDGESGPLERAVKHVADRLAVDFTQTPQQSTGDVRAAVCLVDHLPAIFSLFEQGRLDWERARLIAARLLSPPSSVPDFIPGCPQWQIIETALAVQAPSLARPRLERLLIRLLLDLAPAGAHEATRARRRIWIQPLADGMAFVGIVLPADVAQYVIGVLDAMADAARDQAAADGVPDLRTHMQLCVDALAALFITLGYGGNIPIVPIPKNPADPASQSTDPRKSRTSRGSSSDGGEGNGGGADRGGAGGGEHDGGSGEGGGGGGEAAHGCSGEGGGGGGEAAHERSSDGGGGKSGGGDGRAAADGDASADGDAAHGRAGGGSAGEADGGDASASADGDAAHRRAGDGGGGDAGASADGDAAHGRAGGGSAGMHPDGPGSNTSSGNAKPTSPNSTEPSPTPSASGTSTTGADRDFASDAEPDLSRESSPDNASAGNAFSPTDPAVHRPTPPPQSPEPLEPLDPQEPANPVTSQGPAAPVDLAAAQGPAVPQAPAEPQAGRGQFQEPSGRGPTLSAKIPTAEGGSTDLLDEILDEQEAAHRREQSLFGIGSFPRPEGSTEKDALIPAWWRFRDLPRRKGRGPQLVITSTDAAWLGLDNTPALLRGYGAISAEQARELGAKPDQITILVFPAACPYPHPPHPTAPEEPGGTGNPSGKTGTAGAGGEAESPEVADAGQECAYGQDHTSDQATRYRPGRALTDLIAAAFSTCTFPNCGRPTTHCDLDHLRPFSKGGASCICNLRPACRRHHQLKTSGHWQARASRPDEPYPPGTVIWTTPDGHSHPSTLTLPGQSTWASSKSIDPQALRQALEARGRQPRSQVRDQRNPADSAPGEPLTREDTMTAAERTRLRQERWRKDLQRQAGIRPRQGGRSSRSKTESTAQQEKSSREPTAQAGPFGAIWPSVANVQAETGEPPF